jgi:cytochrome c biogenesis protein CcdA
VTPGVTCRRPATAFLPWAVCAAVHCLLFCASVRCAQTADHPNVILREAVRAASEARSAAARTEALIEVAEAAADLKAQDLCREALEAARVAAADSRQPDPPLGTVAEAALRCDEPAFALEVAGALADPGARVEATVRAAAALCAHSPHPRATALLEQAAEAARAALKPDRLATLMVQAAETLATAGKHEQVGRYLAAAVTAASRAGGSQETDTALTRAALLYQQRGSPAEALAVVDSIRAPTHRARALMELGLACEIAPEPADCAALWQDARAAREALPLTERLAVVEDVASRHAQAGDADAALLALREAESAAGEASAAGRDVSLLRAAALYADIGDWQSAARIARQEEDDFGYCQYQAKGALALARDGRAQEAARLVETMDPEFVRYVGPTVLSSLAALYVDARPAADVSRSSVLQSAELRNAVLKELAVRAAAGADYAAARLTLQAIPLDSARRAATVDVAAAALQSAGAAPHARTEFAREALAQIADAEGQLRVLYAMGLAQDAANDEQVRAVAQEIAARTPHWTWQEKDTRSLAAQGALLARAGSPEEAADLVRQAIGKLFEIKCAGCRLTAMKELFQDLFRAGHPGPVEAALEALADDPSNVVRYAAQATEHLPELPRDRARDFLLHALRAARRLQHPQARAQTLVDVASAYAQAGIEPGRMEVAVLAEEVQFRPPVFIPRPSEPAQPRNREGPAVIALFSRAGCRLCREVEEMVDALLRERPYASVEKYSMETSGALNEAMCIGLGVPGPQRTVAPALFSTTRALVGEEIDPESVAHMIEEARGLLSPTVAFAPLVARAQRSLQKRYEAVGLGVVLGAGLTDGVNPCAFAVIVFFVSYLTYLGRNRRQIFWVGAVFTLAVFLTYYAAGLGLATLVDRVFAWSHIVGKVAYGAMAVLVLTAAVLSLRDAALCARGHARRMVLSLPEGLKKKVRLTISRQARAGLTTGGTFALGIVVALIELPCTGQTYLPVITYMVDNSATSALGPLAWLFLYNLCFIVPLIVVFLAVFFGLSSERLTAVFQRRMAVAKLALGVFFAVLFCLMLWQFLSLHDQREVRQAGLRPEDSRLLQASGAGIRTRTPSVSHSPLRPRLVANPICASRSGRLRTEGAGPRGR